MFVFKGQFGRYNRPFVAMSVGKDGYYDTETGQYIPPSESSEVEMQGIILQLNDDDLKFEEGGLLTSKDKKILLDTERHKLDFKQHVLIDGLKYQVHNVAPYDRYSHFQKVIVRRVSVGD